VPLKIELLEFHSLNKATLDKIHLMMSESFQGHFTSLLTQKQLKSYFSDLYLGNQNAKIHLATQDSHVIGFAILGNEISLVKTFYKFKNLADLFLLLAKLFMNPNILFSSLHNFINRESQNKNKNIKKSNSIYLAYICTDKNYHSKGKGSMLMKSVKDNLKDTKLKYLYCHMDSTDEVVNNFYIKNGWVVDSPKSKRSLAWFNLS
jgi:ribosomal protein S18 acetylase RimI-like enzyme